MDRDEEAASGTKPVLTASDVRAVLGLPPEPKRESVSPPDHAPDADDLTPEMIADLVGQWPGDDELAPAPEPSPVEDGPSAETDRQQPKSVSQEEIKLAAYNALTALSELRKSLELPPDDTDTDKVLRAIEDALGIKPDGTVEHEKPGFRPVQWLSRLFRRNRPLTSR